MFCHFGKQFQCIKGKKTDKSNLNFKTLLQTKDILCVYFTLLLKCLTSLEVYVKKFGYSLKSENLTYIYIERFCYNFSIIYSYVNFDLFRDSITFYRPSFPVLFA